MNIFIIFLMIFTSIYSQDRLDPQPALNLLSVPDSIFISTPNKFKKGWNWSSDSRKLDSALLMNYDHTGINVQALANGFHYRNGMIFMFAPSGNGATKNSGGYTQCMSFQYEPRLRANKSEFSQFIPGDSLGATFGFEYNYLLDSTYELSQDIYHNLKVMPYLLDSLGVDSLLILKDPWPNNKLHNIRYMNIKHDTISDNIDLSDNRDISGEEWYLTLRLKALEDITPINENDTILSITMPYKALARDSLLNEIHSEELIKFDKIPRSDLAPGAIDSIYTDRNEYIGLARGLENYTASNRRIWYITGKMLKRISPIDSTKEYITLSSHFICDSIFPIRTENPQLQNAGPYKIVKHVELIDDSIPRITNLGINVSYHKSIGVAIDWFRIETPKFQRLIRGEFDSAIMANVDVGLNQIHSIRPDIKVEKFFGIDEFWEAWYGSQRYYGKLVGGRMTNEFNIKELQASHLLNATGFDEFWNGFTTNLRGGTSTPIFRRADYLNGSEQSLINEWDRLGLENGYYGKWRTTNDADMISTNRMPHFHDTLRSAYETWIDRHSTGYTDENLYQKTRQSDLYELTWGNGTDTSYSYPSVQMMFGLLNYQAHYKRPGMLFNEKPFWGNIWTSKIVRIDTVSTNKNFKFTVRPHTGEEFSHQIWNNIILGAKGLLYYHGATGLGYDSEDSVFQFDMCLSRIHHGVWLDPTTHNNMPMGDELLYSDYLGGDWLNNQEVYKFYNKS